MKFNFDEMTEFQKKVLEITMKIPKGKVATYGFIAEIIGNKSYSRAVGNALHKNPYPIEIPCHRVIRSDGLIGNYAKGTKYKEKLLKEENVIIEDEKIDLLKFLVAKEILLK